MTTLWIGLGGAVGSIARYQLGLATARRLGTGFPYGTLAVNLIGSMLLAMLLCLAAGSGRIPEPVKLGLGAGVLGGFTTYSSFNYELLALAQRGDWSKAALYLTATVIGCLATGALGWLGARALLAG